MAPGCMARAWVRHGDGGRAVAPAGLVDAAFVARLKVLVQRAGLPLRGAVLDAADNAGRYLELMRVDKKAEAGEIRFVLIDGPGRACVRAAPDALVREVIDACCAG
jgi:3-dehydroquinate synthase